jgi:hypothetical protein
MQVYEVLVILHAFLELPDLALLPLLEYAHPLDEFALRFGLLGVNLGTLLRELLEVEEVLDSKLLGLKQLAQGGVRVLSQLVV